MITIGIDNSLDLAKETISFLKAIAAKNQIRLYHLIIEQTLIYKKNKALTVKRYLEEVLHPEQVDLCLIELTKESMENEVYKQILFDCIILFDETPKKNLLYNIYFESKLRRHAKTKYFVIPDTTPFKAEQFITYGWTPSADVTLTSNEEGPEGNISIQCLVQHDVPTLEGHLSTPLEFPIKANVHRPESLLAGVAALILYGLNFDEFLAQNKTYNLV